MAGSGEISGTNTARNLHSALHVGWLGFASYSRMSDMMMAVVNFLYSFGDFACKARASVIHRCSVLNPPSIGEAVLAISKNLAPNRMRLRWSGGRARKYRFNQSMRASGVAHARILARWSENW